MKQVLSIVLLFAFVLQTAATTIAMPSNHILKFEKTTVSKKHTCCHLKKENKSLKTEKQSKKDCCKGDAKMGCCVVQIATEPQLFQYTFVPLHFSKKTFSYSENQSEYHTSFFQPPRFV